MKALRWVAIVGAVCLLAVGIWLDEPASTMMNAVMLCLSCIGVG